MAAVSQLAEFASSYRPRSAPGLEVVVTPRFQMQLIPDFPLPGPNNVSWVRCEPDAVGDVVREAEAIAAERGVPLSWIIDPGVQPPDLGERLAEHGILPEPDENYVDVMILPVGAPIEMPAIPGLEMRDALADLDSLAAAEQVAAEAFGNVPFGQPTAIDGLRERRLANHRAMGNRRVVLATLDGEPAGSASITIFAPHAAMINGGAVRPKFRGRGVYRAMVVTRLAMAREAGAAGLFVWGGSKSAPILSKLGFEVVSWRRFYMRPGDEH